MKKITILFPDPHLSYSPTVIGLYDLLSSQFDISIVSLSPSSFDKKVLPNRRVAYIKKTHTLGFRKYPSRILFELRSFLKKDYALLKAKGFCHRSVYEYDFIRAYLAKEKPHFIIAVDFKNLWFTQIMGKRVDFLSLEIKPNDVFYDRCDFQNINSIIIQSKERYQYLFKERELKTFFIQNAPVYKPATISYDRKGLVYCGTAWDPFGFYHILDFLKAYPENTLTVQGALMTNDRDKVETEYQSLAQSERLVIEDKYLDDTEVVEYLRKYRIGFCFYNFDLDWINTFNYFYVPSGKMFKYFAAGVPVVGIDIPGLKPVNEFDCGVLIKDLSPKSIKTAIDIVEANFDYYSANCLKAAQYYSFDKAVEPFRSYLLSRGEATY